MNALIITMLKIVVSMAVGFLLYKLRILNNTVNKGLSGLIVHVTAPCMVFVSIVSMDGSEIRNAVKLLWIGVVIYIALMLIAVLCVKLLRIPSASSGVYQAAIVFGNVGFLGLPLAESLFGPVGLFYMALLNIHLNLLVYSYGFYIIGRNSQSGFRFSPKTLINSGIIGVLVAMLFFFLQIPIPDLVMEPISFVGGITSPLAMVVIGSSAAAASLKTVFSHGKLYILSAIKMLLLPIITYIILKLTIGDGMMTKVLTMYVGMPTAAIVGMIAITFDSDAETASSATAMMNIFCIITIPVLYLIMTYF
ncbi:MAG: AEC family transporter [Parasporobacterium sp.]|nr:AEC family transporter [Parasporobacterium sp.]